MPTYLLTWNPNKWEWFDLDEDIRHLTSHGCLDGRWSCAATKRIREGDRVFLLRQGREPRGLVASGFALGDVFVAPHWKESETGESTFTRYIMVRFDIILDAAREPIFRREWLESAIYAQVHWNTQVSGITIPENVVHRLELDWARFLAQNNYLQRATAEMDSAIGDEAGHLSGYAEGAVRKVLVNAYERSPEARRACIRRHGPKCVVCGFDFAQVYGDIGIGYIHTHHLVPLSDIGKKYVLDPTQDMRPVCPNCHAILHRQTPPYSVEELQRLIAIRRGRGLGD